MKRMLILGLALMLTGCGEEAAKPTASTEAATPAAALPANLIATTQPAGAQDVVAVKASAKAGDAVVITGKVAGTEQPLADNRAIMTILDSNVKTCDSMPGDVCKTPWDACCEPANVRAAKSATVQVVDAEGKPLKATLKGVGGIQPLRKVVVAGTAKPSGDALIVEAKQIYVMP